MNKTGIGTPNGPADLAGLFDLGELGTYLCLDVAGVEDQIRQIRGRFPKSRIVIRRYGGIGTDPAQTALEMATRYAALGVRDWVPFNEIDLEEGATAAQTAIWAAAFERAIRPLCPGIRLHFPAFSAERFYQDPDQWIWIPAARACDVIDIHAYLDAAHVKAYIDWAAARFPDKPCLVTEFNYGLGNPRPANYGEEIYRAFAHAAASPNCEGVCPFIWTWVNGPTQELDISRDPEAQAAIRQATADFHAPEPIPPEPEPEPEKPMDPIVKSMMLWQANNCRENTVEDWVRTLSLGGIATFKMKTHQAQTWMKRNYSHPLAPGSVADVARLYEAFRGHGIDFVPWCVPMLLDLEAEAKLAIDVARACGNRIEIDLEVGADFIDRPYWRRVVPYFQILADAEITVDVDTACFEGWMEALSIEEISGLVRRISSQSYWAGFQKPYEDVIRNDLATLRAVTDGEIGVVGDARAPRAEMLAAAAFAQSLGAVEWSCWSADMATPETYAGFALIPGRTEEEPQPAEDHWQEMNAAFHRGWEISQPGVTTLPDGTDISDEGVVLAEVSRILGIVDRHRAALAGE